MSEIPPAIESRLGSLAEQYEVSRETVQRLYDALARGHGTMAQFDIPELGGPGQWMQGGMTMVGEMGNDFLRDKVNGLCADLARLTADSPAPAESGARKDGDSGGHSSDWWPAGLGSPDASGAQGGVRYAVFGGKRRLAIERGGRVTVYDTGDHRIGGVSQSQGRETSLTFTSQHGDIRLDDLKPAPG